MNYIFDTTAISSLIKRDSQILKYFRERQRAHVMCLCTPVHFEVRRGLLSLNATAKTSISETEIRPLFVWTRLVDADWEQAAHYWADARRRGKQLSDVDLLIAALATRLDGLIVSDDQDFDALTVRRENWRIE